MKKVLPLLTTGIFLLSACGVSHDDPHEVSVAQKYIRTVMANPNTDTFCNNDNVTQHGDNTWTISGCIDAIGSNGPVRDGYDVTLDQNDKVVKADMNGNNLPVN